MRSLTLKRIPIHEKWVTLGHLLLVSLGLSL
jgi:hypothetical protein